MRWHRTVNGDQRVLRRFALWPVVIGDEWVWMEPYWVHQQYYEFCGVGWSTLAYGTKNEPAPSPGRGGEGK